MLAQDLIQEVRNSTQQLWNAHILFLNTNGIQGLRCFCPQLLWQKLQRTDDEILAEAKKYGIEIKE